MPKVKLLCFRNNKTGAKYTIISGEPKIKRNLPKDKAHPFTDWWHEIIDKKVGHRFVVLSVNSQGLHNCFRAKITGEDSFEIIRNISNKEHCDICNLK